MRRKASMAHPSRVATGSSTIASASLRACGFAHPPPRPSPPPAPHLALAFSARNLAFPYPSFLPAPPSPILTVRRVELYARISGSASRHMCHHVSTPRHCEECLLPSSRPTAFRAQGPRLQCAGEDQSTDRRDGVQVGLVFQVSTGWDALQGPLRPASKDSPSHVAPPRS